MSSGHARIGIIYRIKIEGIDAELTRKILHLAQRRVVSREFETKALMSREVTRPIPYFSLANYSTSEQVAMRKLHPQKGGELRESGEAFSWSMGSDELEVGYAWESDFLGYLLSRGVSRHPGTTTDFVEAIKRKGKLRLKVFAEVKKIARAYGVKPAAVSITRGFVFA